MGGYSGTQFETVLQEALAMGYDLLETIVHLSDIRDERVNQLEVHVRSWNATFIIH